MYAVSQRRVAITTTISAELDTRAREFMKKHGVERGFYRDCLNLGMNIRLGGQTSISEQIVEAMRQRDNFLKLSEFWKTKYMELEKARHDGAP